MPRWSARRASTSTWSRTVTNGKREPHGRPSEDGDAGPGRALAAAEDVGRDDEPVVGVERPAGSDQAVPPAGRRMARTGRTADVAVAGERVLDQHGVVSGPG